MTDGEVRELLARAEILPADLHPLSVHVWNEGKISGSKDPERVVNAAISSLQSLINHPGVRR